ncbi:non-ribosomal peptide synthetase [Kutzneria sp. 744]|uniref:non-ribosomal peptide synthetase n=1 Tax=Kutzneria sp. (strain 744) TaxID=345341 RepID=UPI0003EEC614|nr:non-ribosomal peptide synthetase [Kutzneria sp. 744]EWM13724.1 non-ribosomal peptide synthetase [Kutzneria sp. 744]
MSPRARSGEPENAVLARLNELAREVLGAPSGDGLPPARSFVQLGGDSLAAMLLASRTTEDVGRDLSVSALLGPEPLAAVLERAARGRGVPTAAVTAGAALDDVPTVSQRGMWADEQVVGEPVYNLVFSAVLEGELEVGRLESALVATARRHDGLRTCFPTADGDLRRLVLADRTPDLERVRVPAAGFAQHVRRVVRRRGRLPFAVGGLPPLDFVLVTGGPRQNVLLLVTHHMLLDAWSVGLVLREVFARYAGGMGDQADPPQPDVLVAHQHALRESGLWGEQLSFWREQLAEVPLTVDLPTDRIRSRVRDGEGVQLPFELPAETVDAVRQHAARLGVTPFAHLLTAYGLLASRYTGQRRFLIGVPTTGRPTKALRELVAQCAAVVPVVIDVDDDRTTDEQIRAVQQSLGRSLDHADVPSVELVHSLGIGADAGRNPLVQLVCNGYSDLVDRELLAGGLRVRVTEEHNGRAPMDLSLVFQRTDEKITGFLEFATAVWTREEAARFLDDLVATCEQLTTATRVVEVRGISTGSAALLDALASPTPDNPVDCLDTAFLAQAARTPDAIAVREGDDRLTYRELAAASAAQAVLLRKAGVRPGDVVVVDLPRSIDEVVAVLGVVRAGAAYLGVDERMPERRKAEILRRARPAAAVSHAAAVFDLPVVVCRWRDWLHDDAPEPHVVPQDPERVAFLSFTSGSTGSPKGVLVPHRGIARLVAGADYVDCGPGTRFLRFAPLAFDASTIDLWFPLLGGGCVEVHPPGVPSPAELGRFVVERGVTALWLTSGLFRLLAEFAPGSLAQVRYLLTGGDVVPSEHVRRVLEANPALTVVSGYGPTENSTFTTVHVVDSPEDVVDPLPIGLPVRGTSVHVLDERGLPVPPGAVGELYTGGTGLAVGYLGDQEATGLAFGYWGANPSERLYRTGDLVRLDAQGRLRFLSRRDDQVKVGGFRVEPAEIRQVVIDHPDVADAVVLPFEGAGGHKQLLGAYVPRTPDDDLGERLTEFTGARLPEYMVPARWLRVQTLPVTANGKVDRKALVDAALGAARR